MTIQQLEYITALDRTRHFVKAAEQCGVTQPTLSVMIRKLEEELDCRIFDRDSHPVTPTTVGVEVIRQAQVILFHVRQLNEGIRFQKTALGGSLSMAMIPTVAPYLLPGFIAAFRGSFPEVSLKITELRTAAIIRALYQAELDMAILSTPLDEPGILEVPLYYERFIAYVSPDEPVFKEKEITVAGLPAERMWVLEEGHCLRNQVMNFCDRKRFAMTYEAGSIDTLVKIVDINGGYTIIPELHAGSLDGQQKKKLRKIVRPEATREIALVFRQDFVREGLVNAVVDTVKKIIPAPMLNARLKKFAVRL